MFYRGNYAMSLKEERCSGDLRECLDYGRSFINGTALWNSGRHKVESRCRITETAAGESIAYYQCCSCKAENTFGRKDLFLEDNYDFMSIFGDRDCVIFRRHSRVTPRYRRIMPIEEAWGGPEKCLRSCQGRPLNGPEEIYEAMRTGVPMVGQTELNDEKTGRIAVIEYPIKTANYEREKKLWQMDTGPILFPDLAVPMDQWSQEIALAYIAFNRFDRADFILENPTSIKDGDKEPANVYHYSDIRADIKVVNVLLACDEIF